MSYEVIIIGSGPAGLTAAIYTARARFEPLVIEGPEPGGPLTITTMIENYPGFPQGIDGTELVRRMKKQAERFGARFVSEEVVGADFKKQPFKIKTDKKTYQTKTVIIAIGAAPRRLGLRREARLTGRGVSYCATCDGAFFKDKEVIVVGGGDSAMEEATFLTKFARRVTIVHRSRTLRASKPMQERAFGNPKIDWLWNTEVKDILGKNKVEGVKLINNQTQETSEMKVDGVFLAIGRVPKTALFEKQLELTKGYIVLKPGSTATSKKGVFAAGDCADWTYRQAVTAAGMGCKAALDVKEYLP